MRNKLLSILASTLVFASLSSTAFASTTTANNAKVGDIMTEQQEQISKDFLKSHPDLVSKYNNLKLANNSTQKSNSTLSVQAPAPVLSDYYTYFVSSGYDSASKTITNYEWVDDGRLTTTADFNGTVYVGTVEIGYGREYASFNGSSLSEYDEVLLDFDGDSIIDGFIDVWKIDNVTSGQFSSNATSTNYNSNHPGPFYAQINIK